MTGVEANDAPAISVVMPTYNDGPYLRMAIDSILGQTFTDFEFIIVNDGSTDDTEAIIQSYQDPRIKYLKNTVNLGNAQARNIGMNAATGKYIAMMDSDDVAVPERFGIQYPYLEKHPDIDILGGAIVFFFSDHGFYKSWPQDPDYIRSCLFFSNSVWQPTVMMRRSAIEQAGLKYDADFENGEDFGFWYAASAQGLILKNLKNILLYYRQSDSQMSHPANSTARDGFLKTYFKDKLERLDIRLPEEDFLRFHYFVRGRVPIDKTAFFWIDKTLADIIASNRLLRIYESRSLKAVVFGYRIRLAKYAFWENGKRLAFGARTLTLMLRAGPQNLWLFWNNEGKAGMRYGKELVDHSWRSFVIS